MMRRSGRNATEERFLRRQLVLFFAFAYGIAWLFFVPLALSRAGLGWLPFEMSLPIMTVLGTSGPSLAALLTLRITEGKWPNVQFPSEPKLVMASLIAAPILVAGTFAAIPAIVLTTGPLSKLNWSVFLSGSVFTLSTLIGGPLGEEPGWRGFALPRLQTLLSPARASILLGVLWGCWHLPLFLCKAWSSSGLPAYLLIVTGFSFSMTLLFNLSNGSVITAIAVHALFNTASRWLNGLLVSAPIRDKPSPELILGLSGWAVACLLLAATRGRLAYSDIELTGGGPNSTDKQGHRENPDHSFFRFIMTERIP